jgi:hypothetical protein
LVRKYAIADYVRLDHAIWNGGLPTSSAVVRRFFKACLLSAVRRISNADPSPVSGLEITKHMRERLAAGYDVDVVAEFERRVRVNIERMNAYVSYLREEGTIKTQVNIVWGDCLNIVQLNGSLPYRADLILFSPPYCNAIEYWRRHRLEYFLGGFLTREQVGPHQKTFVGRRAVGGRSALVPHCLGQGRADNIIQSLHASGRYLKAWQLWHYFHDMKERLVEFYAVLPPAGRAVIIVGDSRTSGHEIPTAQILQDLAVAGGFEFEAVVRYAIKDRVMQYPLKAGCSKISEESIVVFRKPRTCRGS